MKYFFRKIFVVAYVTESSTTPKVVYCANPHIAYIATNIAHLTGTFIILVSWLLKRYVTLGR